MHLAEQVYRGIMMNQKYKISRCLALIFIIISLTGCASNDPSSDSDHRRPPLINNESFTNFVPIDIIEIPTNDVSINNKEE